MKKILFITALSVLLAACGQGQGDSRHFAPVDPAAHEVWQLVQGEARGKTLNLQAHNAPITLIFSKDGISGQSPINRYQAAAETAGGTLQLTDHIMITKAGAERAAMHLESDYLQALRGAQRWQREGNRLILSGQGIRLDYILQGSAQ